MSAAPCPTIRTAEKERSPYPPSAGGVIRTVGGRAARCATAPQRRCVGTAAGGLDDNFEGSVRTAAVAWCACTIDERPNGGWPNGLPKNPPGATLAPPIRHALGHPRSLGCIAARGGQPTGAGAASLSLQDWHDVCDSLHSWRGGGAGGASKGRRRRPDPRPRRRPEGGGAGGASKGRRQRSPTSLLARP